METSRVLLFPLNSGVAAGSSCQMALLVTPFSVLVGWAPLDAENPEFSHGSRDVQGEG